MASWFTMPRGEDAKRQAVITELRHNLSAIECAVRLLHDGKSAHSTREIIVVVRRELHRSQRALRRLSDSIGL